MGNALRAARTGLILLGLAGAGFAPAAKKPAGQLAWWIGQFNYLKRVPKESDAPANDQPIRLSPEMVRQDLMAIHLGKKEALFGLDEINGLVPAICEAMAQATPDEDLIVLSTSSRSSKLFATRTALTARLFVKEGRLNLIVRDARLRFYDRYLGTNTVPDFKFGSRTESTPVELECKGAGTVRGNWLTFPVVLEVKASEDTDKAMAAAPVAAAAPAPAAAAAPVSAPAAAPQKAKDQAYFEQQQQRLRSLKRMRDDDLITDAEYSKKRQEIIDGL